jgi:5'-methylthioadenosine phosphorylase
VFGLITGTGLYDIPELIDRAEVEVATPYREVVVTTGTWRGRPVAFLPRHAPDHSVPPHAIDYRANIWGLWSVGVESIVATAVSGAIDPALRPGDLVLISDFLELTTGREDTFFDGVTDPGFGAGGGPAGDRPVVHTDMTSAYHPRLRAQLARAAEAEGIELAPSGVYCTTNGPRFETPAEIQLLAAMGGHLVGMTGYPEVALAAEAGIPYASIGVVSNLAAGLADRELAVGEIMGIVAGAADRLHRLIGRAIELSAATGIAP